MFTVQRKDQQWSNSQLYNQMNNSIDEVFISTTYSLSIIHAYPFIYHHHTTKTCSREFNNSQKKTNDWHFQHNEYVTDVTGHKENISF